MAHSADPHFPILHRVHRQGWINDPNGIMKVEDRWHVFFQYNPHSTCHEQIHWGHMSSPDLVNWREEPLGPQPRAGEADSDGCWSGVGLVDRAHDPAGVPTLVYSGVGAHEDNQFADVIVSRMDAGATELVEPGRVVAGIPDVPGLIGIRDPFVFETEGRRWAIQGAGIREGEGSFVPAILLYSCDDLDQWNYEGPLLTGDHPVAAQHAPAHLWECPQLVQVGDDWVLLVSLWLHPDTAERSTVQVNYLRGSVEPTADGLLHFEPVDGGRVDLGPDFYAPQAVVDHESDRVLLWGWSWESLDRTQEQTDEQGWAGVLTFPRELQMREGHLVAAVPAELAALRGRALDVSDGPADGHSLELPVPARAEVAAHGALRVDVVAADGAVTEILRHEGETAEGEATVFIDGSLLELIPCGVAPTTVRCYPQTGDTLRITGAIGEAWELSVASGSPRSGAGAAG